MRLRFWRRKSTVDGPFVTTGYRYRWPSWATERTEQLPTVDEPASLVRPYLNAAERAARRRNWERDHRRG